MNKPDKAVAVTIIVAILAVIIGVVLWIEITTEQVPFDPLEITFAPDSLGRSTLAVSRHPPDSDKPYAEQRWSGREGNAYFGQMPGPLEMDLMGFREPISINGSEGWLWRLSANDFVPPDLPAYELPAREWRADRLPYFSILLQRRNPSLGNAGALAGPALGIQWETATKHHVLVAQDRPPMTGGILKAMAESTVLALNGK